MTNIRKLLTLSIFALLLSNQAMAVDCLGPKTPSIADGSSATKDELIASQKDLKAYQANLAVYRECLQAKSDAVNELAEDADAQKAALVNLYNQSVDEETVAAEQFNAAIRAYKSKLAK